MTGQDATALNPLRTMLRGCGPGALVQTSWRALARYACAATHLKMAGLVLLIERRIDGADHQLDQPDVCKWHAKDSIHRALGAGLGAG